MKLFGEFLVEKSLITSDQLAEALIEQVKEMPSYVEVAWRLKILNADKLLSVLKLQTKKQIGFVEAMRELKIWNDEIEHRLINEINSLRKPLGQILIANDVVKMESITHALDEYLSMVNDVPEEKSIPADSGSASESKIEKQEAQQEKESKNDIKENTKEEADESNSSASLEAYCEVFNEELQSSINQFIDIFEQGKALEEKTIKDFFEIVHRVRGVSRLAGFKKCEEICALFESGITLMLKIKVYPDDLVASLARTAKSWSELTWSLRGDISQNIQVETIFAKKEIQELNEKFSGLAEVFKFDAEMAALSGGNDK